MALRSNFTPLGGQGHFRGKALREPCRSPEPGPRLQSSPAPSLCSERGLVSSRRRAASPLGASIGPSSPLGPSSPGSSLSAVPGISGAAPQGVASGGGTGSYVQVLQDVAPFSARFLSRGQSSPGSISARLPMSQSSGQLKSPSKGGHGEQSSEGPCGNSGFRAASSQRLIREIGAEIQREIGEDTNGSNNASTRASSVCDSLALSARADHDAANSSSSRVLFAKASELIRVEIAACERRFAAKMEQERSAREGSNATLKSSLENMVYIVEALSSAPQAQGSSEAPALMNHSIASRIEAERAARDEVCSSLLAKIETMSAQIERLPAAAMIDEDRINTLLEKERKQRNSAMTSLDAKLQALSDELHSLPAAIIDGAASWSKFNVLLDTERAARADFCSQLRKDMDALSSSVEGKGSGADDDYLQVLLEQERRVNDLSRATLWKDFCRELEALSEKVDSLKNPAMDEERVRALMDQDKIELYAGTKDNEARASCSKLAEDVESLTLQLRSVQEDSEALALELKPGSTFSTPSQQQVGTKASPLQTRLESTAHLAFQSPIGQQKSAPPLPCQPKELEATSIGAFQSIFANKT